MKKIDRKRDERITNLYTAGGVSYTDLARMFGITRQRVHQIVKSTIHRFEKVMLEELDSK